MRITTAQARGLRSGAGSPGLWFAFALGIAAGVGLSALFVGRALGVGRRTRATLPWSRARRSAPVLYPPADVASFAESDAARAARNWPDDDSFDDELDAELEQTFPASDPLPYSHRVD